MAHRMYLYNAAEAANPGAERVAMVEWSGDFPSLLSPLLAGSPFLERNLCNDTGEADGLYALAEEGKAQMRAFYALLERHAGRLIDDIAAFRQAKRQILAFLANRAVHRYFHLDGWDRFNLSDETHAAQAAALLARIQRDNARIRAAVEADDPALLEDCEGWRHEGADSFRSLLNAPHVDYGWEALTSAIFDEAEIVEANGLFGLHSVAGELLIPPSYDEIIFDRWGMFDPWGIAIVRQGARYGYIHKSGRQLTPVAFEAAQPFGGAGFAIVSSGGRFGAIDADGVQVVACRYEALETMNYRIGALWAACEGGRWGVIGPGGHWRLAPGYERVAGEAGAIFATRTGEAVSEVYTRQLVRLGVFPAEQLVQFELRDDGAGEMADAERAVVHYWPPADGVARPLRDADGAVLLELAADDALELIDETAFYMVCQRDRYGLFHGLARRWLLLCEYMAMQDAAELASYEERKAGWVPLLVAQGGRWGLYQAAPLPGWLIPPAYDALKLLCGEWLLCQDGACWGIVSRHGKVLHAPRYTEILLAEAEGVWLATGFRDGGVFALHLDSGEKPLPAEAARNVLDVYVWLERLDETQRQVLERAAGGGR